MTKAALPPAALCFAALLVTACVQPAEDAASRGRLVASASTPAPVEAPAATGGRGVKEADDLLDFSYGWPAEAEAIAPLAARLEADLAALRDEARGTAWDDRAARPAEAPFNGHYFSKLWTAHGASPRLLSLAAKIETYTGGAHGNATFEGMLWDRAANRPIALADLFANPDAAFDALTASYCEALDRQRAEKRQVSLPLQGEDWLVACPALKDQTVIPVDGDGDGRFERLLVLIAPYEAGPYAEGSYELELPVSGAVRRLVKPDYAASF